MLALDRIDMNFNGHEEARRLEKTRKNLCKSVQSAAEFCSREHIDRVAAEFQGMVNRHNYLCEEKWKKKSKIRDYRTLENVTNAGSPY